MTWLLEEPLQILFVGTLVVAVAAVAWVQTSHPRALLGLIAAVALLALGLLVERLVVTSAEEVEATLQAAARALESNEPEQVIALVADSSSRLRNEIRSALATVRVEKISIKSNLRVTVAPGRPPAAAEAFFNAVATLKPRGVDSGMTIVPRRVVVRFRRQQQQWKIVDYETFDPRGEAAGR